MVERSEVASALKHGLLSASAHDNPVEQMRVVVKRFFPGIKAHAQDDALHIEKLDGRWLSIRVAAPSNFLVNENHYAGAKPLAGFSNGVSSTVDNLVDEILKTAGSIGTAN
jgi:hypothetical protein